MIMGGDGAVLRWSLARQMIDWNPEDYICRAIARSSHWVTLSESASVQSCIHYNHWRLYSHACYMDGCWMAALTICMHWVMDTDQQKATAGWLSWLQQPTSRTPGSTASRTFCGSASGYSQPDPAFRPTLHNPTKTELGCNNTEIKVNLDPLVLAH